MIIIKVKIVDLICDSSYQREIKDSVINKIVSNYNPNLMGVLTVVSRDGKYFVIDGQHRRLALEILKIESVYCIVTECENEATLYLELNGRLNGIRRPISNADAHKALLVKGDKEATDIRDIMLKNNFITSSGNYRISAISTLQRIYRRYGADMLEKTLVIITYLYNGESSSYNSDIINGFSYFLSKSTSTNDCIIDKLKTMPVDMLKNSAKLKVTNTGVSFERAFAMVLLEKINFRKSKKILIDL